MNYMNTVKVYNLYYDNKQCTRSVLLKHFRKT